MAGPNSIAGDIFAVTYDSLYLGQQVITTLHYRVNASSSGTVDLTTTYTGLRNKLDEIGGISFAYAELFTTDVTSIKLRIQKVYPTRYVQQTFFSNPGAGTRTAPDVKLPATLAAALTLKSLLAGPTEHGTKHILITSPDDCENGVISSAFNTLLDNFGTLCTVPFSLEDAASGVIMDPVVYHRAAPGASKIVEISQVQTTARVMRRRTVGQGS